MQLVLVLLASLANCCVGQRTWVSSLVSAEFEISNHGQWLQETCCATVAGTLNVTTFSGDSVFCMHGSSMLLALGTRCMHAGRQTL